MRALGSTARALRRRLVTILAAACVAVVTSGTSRACVGDGCMTLWSTEEGGGALAINWDFVHRQQIQTFKTPLCDASMCLYSAIDPGFMTPGGTPPDGFHTLADGTAVSLEIVAADAAVTVKIGSIKLTKPGDSTSLGSAPDLHQHPAWQLSLPTGQTGEYPLSFKLTTDSAQYAESQVYSVLLTNLPTPTPNAPTPTETPTPTPTQAVPACAGDCNDDGVVAVNELILGVTSALDGEDRCPACDRNGNGVVEIAELVSAVDAALDGCPAPPTPTATLAPTLDDIQRTIFSPRCAIPACHDSQSKAGNLILEAGRSHDQLVGVSPTVDTAGLLRVDPGHPENSFLLVKLEGPPPDQGQRMPLTGALLNEAEIQLISDWIAQGAEP